MDGSYVSKQGIENAKYSRQTFQDGSYYADVEYKNNCTKFKNFYKLEVDIQGDSLKRINFENGGHLNESHIISQIVPDNGKVLIKNRDGCSEYLIQIISD